jgi:hypothetical protein
VSAEDSADADGWDCDLPLDLALPEEGSAAVAAAAPLEPEEESAASLLERAGAALAHRAPGGGTDTAALRAALLAFLADEEAPPAPPPVLRVPPAATSAAAEAEEEGSLFDMSAGTLLGGNGCSPPVRAQVVRRSVTTPERCEPSPRAANRAFIADARSSFESEAPVKALGLDADILAATIAAP